MPEQYSNSRGMRKKKSAKRKSAKRVGATDVTRQIKVPVRSMLWGKAAGRCEFAGCNKPLWKSSITQEQVNIAQAAHIYAFSEDGPRGNKGIMQSRLNELGNLMLVCHPCHKTIDADQKGVRYSVELLKQWKDQHEQRIEKVTQIDLEKKSHVLLYGANIGDHSGALTFTSATHALFPDHYPEVDEPIEIGIVNSTFKDHDEEFWEIESKNLENEFSAKVEDRMRLGKIRHLSVFGLAPQPLLIYLGTLLKDIIPAQIYQRHREPVATWDWPETAHALELQIKRPDRFVGPPALVLSLTAAVHDDRVNDVVKGCSIWTVTIPRPAHDHIRSPADLSIFRKEVRMLLDEIKERHGQTTPLHVFPVAGNAVNIEFGRIRMGKAMMPWIVYDQNNKLGGFARAIAIN